MLITLVSAPAEAGDDPYETTVAGDRPRRVPGQAQSSVTREDLDERLPRSAPDALRYEPGVYVQQTAHGQGSPYIRARTGQQTVLLFDGIRLNTSTFRQGPNQYFFTVDARSISRLEVLRGGASTLFGADALGGAIIAFPLQPPPVTDKKQRLTLHPAASLRYGSADHELGGRAQLGATVGRRLGILAGVGYRRAGLLRGGGQLAGATVPRLDDDGATQLGTGFHELASDLRVVYELSARLRLTAALYDYRQFEAPRTDQCPPPLAPRDDCLVYEEQFRTLTYVALDGRGLGRAARELRASLSYQNQHERRARNRPSSFVQHGGRDDVHTLGLALHARAATVPLSSAVAATLRYGADGYLDRLASTSWTRFDDVGLVIFGTRGQYLGGSAYFTGGVFGQLELWIDERFALRGGVRGAFAAASAPGDVESGSAAISRRWGAAVANAGLEWRILRPLSLLARVDRSFRPPNLDDLTSRQQTGPGFQLENPALVPEQALSFELGLQLSWRWLKAESWIYTSTLAEAIERAPRSASACPAATPQCQAAFSRLQLVNLDGDARLWGAELVLRAEPALGLALRASLAYARGEGPHPIDAALPRQPLSRVPPINGTIELRWRHRLGLFVGGALRWALVQDQLSLADLTDARIPPGGTPGFAVVDLRAGMRMRRWFASLIFENVGDAVYRYHGSSINGAGRSLLLHLEGRL